ncbi:far-red impaired responsive (FAR1) family protein [Actinidia rufa]|uniref:Far-red impaired responsive (FAR1) family protein n=1 Tax=Actinidia rufa TaxID=165716 RepID=A0A7J0FHB9_9ERIC|nr:far-red impaired responsive (FAR1) family protein [Actinidia rufa]
MDVEAIDLENVDNYMEVDEGDLEINEHAVVGSDNSTENFLSTQDEVGIDEPHIGMEFESEDAAKTFYDEYARRVGFSTCVNQFNRSEPSDKTNARESFFLCKGGLEKKKFKVHYLRPRRLFSGANKGMDESYSEDRTSSPVMMHVSVDGNHVSGERNRGNPRAKTLVRSGHIKGTIGDAQNLLDYFKNMQEEGAIAVEMYCVAMNAIREGRKKVAVAMKDAAKVTPKPQVYGGQEDGNKEIDVSKAEMTPLLWPHVQAKHHPAFNDSDMNRTPWRSYQDEATHPLNRNNIVACTPTPQKDLPCMAPLSLQRDDGTSNNTVILPYLRSMTWFMENKSLRPAKRVAVINFKLQDYGNDTSGETEVKFQLSKVTLEPMLSSMASIGEQLATAANQVAVINLKSQPWSHGGLRGGPRVVHHVSAYGLLTRIVNQGGDSGQSDEGIE